MGINELNATGIRELLGTLQSRNLNTGILLVTTALILATTVFIQVFLQYRRLRHIPGPFLNSITPLVLTYHCFKGDISAYIASLGFKYGPLVRISPNMVLFWDVDTFRRICHGKSAYTKGLWFEFSRWDLKNYSLIAMRDNESRRERKSKIAPAVSDFSSLFVFSHRS